jgi:moderate conductance mechanosensitive channel
VAVMLPVQVDDPLADGTGLLDACGVDPGAVCEAVWNATDNAILAKLADLFVGRLLTAIVIVVAAWIIVRVARRLVRRGVYDLIARDSEVAAKALEKVGIAPSVASVDDPRRRARGTSIATVVASTVTVVIWVIATLLVLGELGINLAPLIAGAGIAGVALGFGAQNLVKDCVAGLFMLIEDQYGIGDVVDLGVASGPVERVTLRTTVLRGQDGTVWHVPNGEIRRVGNSSKMWSVAVVDVVVSYHADLDVTRQVVHDVATRVVEADEVAGDVLAAPEILGVESVSPDHVTLRLTVRTAPGAQFRLQRALREALKRGLDDAEIQVAPAPEPPAE